MDHKDVQGLVSHSRVGWEALSVTQGIWCNDVMAKTCTC